jgi:hypothetical protein
MARGRRDPERERFWRDALRRQACGGVTIRAFCAGEGLAVTAFHAWRRVLRERDAERARPGPAPAFVPVVVHAAADRPEPAADIAPADVVIELRGGRAMRLPASMPAGQLAALVHAIEVAGGAADVAAGGGEGAA